MHVKNKEVKKVGVWYYYEKRYSLDFYFNNIMNEYIDKYDISEGYESHTTNRGSEIMFYSHQDENNFRKFIKEGEHGRFVETDVPILDW